MRLITQKRTVAALLTMLVVAAPAFAADANKKPPFAVKVVGKGRPMILIPGLACSGAVWDSTVEHFKNKYECHVLTLAGFAGQPPVPGPFLDTMRQGIADYIRDRKLDKPVIVGHSLGGFLVFALGISDPELVGPLVAVDGLPCLPAVFNEKIDANGLKQQSAMIRDRMGKAPREQYLTQQKTMLKNWIKDKKHCEDAEKWGADSDQATVAGAMAELFAKDLRPEIGRIKGPVLLLGAWSKEMESYGLKREVVTKRYEDQLAGAPHHKVLIADNSKHFIMFDAPDWMFAQMDAFLGEK
jgi:pimeloyl-ACP methyl ester carboxylesterase